jgi:hypothetical protein
MADISRVPGLRHLRGTPTLHVRHLRRGKVIHAGTGTSFWFRPLSAVLSEVPVDDRQLPLLFHARTADFQDVSVQATVTYRIADPEKADSRLDFSIDPDRGQWRSSPLEQIAGLLTETAQQYAVELLVRTSLADALVDGPSTIRDGITVGLAGNVRLAEIGLDIIGIRVVAIRPESDVERALQTPARELVQQEADKATYERRAMAVERERAIAENELANQIELARREQELVVQRGANARRQSVEAAAANRIDTEAQAERETRLATARADARRSMGEAEAAAETARLAAYENVPQGTLFALMAKEVAGNLPEIGSLVVTPDLVSGLLAKLAVPSTVDGES